MLAPVHPLRDTRRLDWALALFGLAYGAWLLQPGASMDGPGYAILTRWLSEWGWGGLTAAAAGLHILALIVNGGRGWTPYARALINYGGTVIWGCVAVGFWRVDPLTTAVVPYAAISSAHLFCGLAAVRDAARVKLNGGRRRWVG